METVKYKGLDIIQFYKPMTEFDKDKHKIETTECKFVRWIPRSEKNKDTHLVCLVHHCEDGTLFKELKLVEDYKRPFWITKKIHQNYKDKKEYERIERLDLYTTTQSEIDTNVCLALGQQPSRYNMSNVKDSPYLYAYEVPSMSFIKYMYGLKNQWFVSDYEVVNLDIENDVTDKYNDISIITLSTNGYRHTAVLKRLYKNITTDSKEIERIIREKDASDLPDSPAKRDTKVYNITVHDNDLDLIKTIYDILHIMKPDFVTAHNMIHDVGMILKRLEYWSTPAGSVMCDPSMPKNLQWVQFKPAKQFKVKKGVQYGIPPEEQWTTLDTTASFMFMDTMTGYAFVRQAAGKVVGGYGLQNLLEVNGLDGKLNYEDEISINLSNKERHAYMSENKPVEYTIYGNQDTAAMTNLENKNQDFKQAIPIFAGISDFLRYNSSTHRAICNGYLENKEKGLIIGTTPKNPVDRSYLGTKGWIKTLSSEHIQEETGLEITNIPGLKTNVTANADDLDCVSSYPSDIQAVNISAATVRAEIVTVGNIPKKKFKNNNINIVSSNANTVAYCNNMLKLPTIIDMRNHCRELHNNTGSYVSVNKKEEVFDL